MVVSAVAGECTVALSHEADIRGIGGELRRLVRGCPPVLDPDFFLASVDKNSWVPRVVAVMRDGGVLGAVYAKERKVAGIPTGLIYADETVGGMVASSPENRDVVLEAGLSGLLSRRGVRGLRISSPAERFDRGVFERAASERGAEMKLAPVRGKYHSRLRLPLRYDAFLSGLGATSRHNFRYYRRRSEDAGNTYCERLTMKECRAAAYQLAPLCSIPCSKSRLDRVLEMTAAVPERFGVGLRARDGSWLSVVGGWRHGASAMFMFQLNADREHRGDSLSTVLRAYLIETLIREGVHEMVFWGGTAGPLSRYVEDVGGVQVYFDLPALGWRIARALTGPASKVLPKRMALLSEWIVPAR